MVKHIVCFKLKDNSPAAKEEAKRRLLSMQGNVPVIKEIEVVILLVTLANRQALEAYQNDPHHCAYVKPYMHEKRSASVSVDYEF